MKPVTYVLRAWPADARLTDIASVVVHVRGREPLQREIAELKARGLTKVLVGPAGGDPAAWWA